MQRKCPQCHVDHQGLCHACPHNGLVFGSWAQSPCAHCHAAEARIQGHGRNVSFDEVQAVLRAPEPEPEPEVLPERREMADLFRIFMGLSAVQREVIFYFLGNPEGSLQEVAHYLERTFNNTRLRAEQRAKLARVCKGERFKDMRFTLQAVHEQIRALRRLNPAFERILQRVDVRIGLKRGRRG